MGQALSTRPDLLPQIYLDELTELQDALPCFSNEVRVRFRNKMVSAGGNATQKYRHGCDGKSGDSMGLVKHGPL